MRSSREDISFEHALTIARQLKDLPESAELAAQAELLGRLSPTIRESYAGWVRR